MLVIFISACPLPAFTLTALLSLNTLATSSSSSMSRFFSYVTLSFLERILSSTHSLKPAPTML